MKRLFFLIITGTFIIISAGSAMAHYGMLITSDSMVMQNDNRTISLILSFSHPFEGEGMELVKPAVFGVMANGKRVNLLETLKETWVIVPGRPFTKSSGQAFICSIWSPGLTGNRQRTVT